MADDKKNIPEAAPPAEAPAPAVENAAVPEQPAPEPVLTDAEAVMLEHEGQAALFEMGEAVPLIPPTLLPMPSWRSLPRLKSPRLKRNSRPIPTRMTLRSHSFQYPASSYFSKYRQFFPRQSCCVISRFVGFPGCSRL